MEYFAFTDIVSAFNLKIQSLELYLAESHLKTSKTALMGQIQNYFGTNNNNTFFHTVPDA